MTETILEITQVVSEVGRLIEQLQGFIGAFNDVVKENAIEVITDSEGNMSIDVPENMPDEKAKILSKRIGVIDRLITSHGQDIHTLFKHGFELEKSVFNQDPSFRSQLWEQLEQAEKLNKGFKH